jgi:hypothetical protein
MAHRVTLFVQKLTIAQLWEAPCKNHFTPLFTDPLSSKSCSEYRSKKWDELGIIIVVYTVVKTFFLNIQKINFKKSIFTEYLIWHFIWISDNYWSESCSAQCDTSTWNSWSEKRDYNLTNKESSRYYIGAILWPIIIKKRVTKNWAHFYSHEPQNH